MCVSSDACVVIHNICCTCHVPAVPAVPVPCTCTMYQYLLYLYLLYLYLLYQYLLYLYLLYLYHVLVPCTCTCCTCTMCGWFCSPADRCFELGDSLGGICVRLTRDKEKLKVGIGHHTNEGFSEEHHFVSSGEEECFRVQIKKSETNSGTYILMHVHTLLSPHPVVSILLNNLLVNAILWCLSLHLS